MNRLHFLFISVQLLLLGMPDTYGQTYNTLIPDSVYYNFINKDILRDSVKVPHHVYRKVIPLYLDDFYFKDSADYQLKNNDPYRTHFIFRHQVGKSGVSNNGLDTIFNRSDIDFLGVQLRAMKKRTSWKKPFVNSILIKDVEYDTTDQNTFGRPKKYGVWGYSLPLFSLNRQYAIIIKSDAVEEACYIYKSNEKNDWELVKKCNVFAID